MTQRVVLRSVTFSKNYLILRYESLHRWSMLKEESEAVKQAGNEAPGAMTPEEELEALAEIDASNGVEWHRAHWRTAELLRARGLVTMSGAHGPDKAWCRVELTPAGHQRLRPSLDPSDREALTKLLAALTEASLQSEGTCCDGRIPSVAGIDRHAVWAWHREDCRFRLGQAALQRLLGAPEATP